MLKKSDLDWAKEVLEAHKGFFGFQDWKILVEDKTKITPDNNSYAEAQADFTKKELTVLLFNLYAEEKTSRFETLIHELIHGRVSVAQAKLRRKMESLEYWEEEEMVNDITRGVLSLLKQNENRSSRKKQKTP